MEVRQLRKIEPRFYYGHIVVVVAFFIMLIALGLYNVFGIFFLPLLTEFSWTRAMTSGAFSMSMILHGVLATELLGFKAQPVLVFDMAGENEPMGALYQGGTADMYVFYDPCEETVVLLSVSSSRVKYVDRVTCPPP